MPAVKRLAHCGIQVAEASARQPDKTIITGRGHNGGLFPITGASMPRMTVGSGYLCLNNGHEYSSLISFAAYSRQEVKLKLYLKEIGSCSFPDS